MNVSNSRLSFFMSHNARCPPQPNPRAPAHHFYLFYILFEPTLVSGLLTRTPKVPLRSIHNNVPNAFATAAKGNLVLLCHRESSSCRVHPFLT